MNESGTHHRHTHKRGLKKMTKDHKVRFFLHQQKKRRYKNK